MVLIGLLGRKQSGKDTAANILLSQNDFIRLAFADPIKNICRELFGFSEDQLYGNKEVIDEYWNVTPRTTFQYIGAELFRNQIGNILPNVGNNFWVCCLERKYDNIIDGNPDANVVITDVRYQNELEMIHKKGGIIIKIDRPFLETNDNHESEQYIDQTDDFDYCINNDGSIEKLHEQIINIVNELK